jgi:class 3 adenylate cyclase
MTAARRLAAILAADVVGYSRLMGEAVRERREASTPIAAGHGGHIVKTTGDGLHGVSLCGRRRQMRNRDIAADD